MPGTHLCSSELTSGEITEEASGEAITGRNSGVVCTWGHCLKVVPQSSPLFLPSVSGYWTLSGPDLQLLLLNARMVCIKVALIPDHIIGEVIDMACLIETCLGLKDSEYSPLRIMPICFWGVSPLETPREGWLLSSTVCCASQRFCSADKQM